MIALPDVEMGGGGELVVRGVFCNFVPRTTWVCIVPHGVILCVVGRVPSVGVVVVRGVQYVEGLFFWGGGGVRGLFSFLRRCNMYVLWTLVISITISRSVLFYCFTANAALEPSSRATIHVGA